MKILRFKPNIKKIRSIHWYKQGGAIRLFYVFQPYLSINETIGYDRNIIFQKGELNAGFFDRTREEEKTRWLIRRQIKDKKFIDRWIADWKRKNGRLLAFCKQSFAKPVELWSDEDLVNFLRQYSALTLEHWKKGCLIEWTDPDSERILLETIKRFRCKLTIKDTQTLISAEKPGFLQQELIDRYQIVQLANQGKDITSSIFRHSQKYHWIKNSWAYVEHLDEKYFSNYIINDLKARKKIEQEFRKTKNVFDRLKKRKKELSRKFFIPAPLKNVLYLFTRLAEWRDERKKLAACLPNSYLHQILKRLSRMNRISEALAGPLCDYEITGWKLSARQLKTIGQKAQGAIFLCETRDKCQWLYGNQAKRVHQLLLNTLRQEDLQGQVAYQGKATGRVKIIETKNDFRKMKRGDILVAHMTRPEHLPAVRKARAIVTDEGGLTCHAAIVARELKVPCIVGTQFATQILKDGELVKVDANHGIIRKL